VADIRKANSNAYQCRTAGLSNGSGTGPSGTGEDILDFTAHWTYLAATPFPIVATGDGLVYRFLQQLPYPLYSQQFVAALCEGEVVGALTIYFNKERISCQNPTDIGKQILLYVGPDALGQSLAVSGGQWDASGYQHTALIAPRFAAYGIGSGTQQEIPDIALELKGVLLGSSTLDVNPADLVSDLLTHVRRGLGWSAGKVDATTITGAGAASFRTYTDAGGLRFSYYLDTQRTALAILADILDATVSDAYWSSGVLKIVPLADQSITSPVYGATNYVPANTAVYNLTDDHFLDKGRPVQMIRRPDADCFNCFPVEYKDRGAGYTTITVEDPDQTDIHTRGALIRASTASLPFTFPDGTAPTMLSRVYTQRSLNIRNTYTFRLSWKFVGLEPTSIVTLTDTYLGLVLTPVRIVSLRENEDRSITFTAEEYPEGVAAPGRQYAPQVNDGNRANEVITVESLQVGTGSVGLPNSQISTSTTTRGGGVDNIFPNPTSEDNPPPGADLTKAEWVGRVNLGIGTAPAGAWVRSPGTGASLSIDFTSPALPGETYYMEALVAAAVAGANKGGFVKIVALDSTGASLGSSIAGSNDLAAFQTRTAQFAMPAGTTRVQFSLVNGTDAAAHAYFDTIYVRRAIDARIFAVEPWVSTRLECTTSIFLNAAGTTAAYTFAFGGNAGFDTGVAPSLVTVGAEPQPRLRLRLATLPGSLVLGTHVTKFFAFTNRSQAIAPNIAFPSAQLFLMGWNLANRDFDFWLAYDDWTTGFNTPKFPLPWGFGETHVWDIKISLVADAGFKFW
jgi:hypothetical protein